MCELEVILTILVWTNKSVPWFVSWIVKLTFLPSQWVSVVLSTPTMIGPRWAKTSLISTEGSSESLDKRPISAAKFELVIMDFITNISMDALERSVTSQWPTVKSPLSEIEPNQAKQDTKLGWIYHWSDTNLVWIYWGCLLGMGSALFR